MSDYDDHDDYYDDEYDYEYDDEDMTYENWQKCIAEQRKEAVAFESKDQFREIVLEGSGIHFTLLMQDGDDTLIFDRSDQPCYGEMRKYKESHGDLYQDPWNGSENNPTDTYRPNDLHHPLPNGTPIAVGVKFYMLPAGEEFLRFALSDESPWRKGLPSQEHIEIMTKGGKPIGLILWDTNFDPTVLVSLLNCIKCHAKLTGPEEWDIKKRVIASMFYSLHQTVDFNASTKLWKDEPERKGEWVYGPPQVYNQSVFSAGYYTSMTPCIHKLLTGEVNDLGGKMGEKGNTFKNGGDYNRVRLHDVFTSDEKEPEFNREFQERTKGLTAPEEVHEIFSAMYDDVLASINQLEEAA